MRLEEERAPTTGNKLNYKLSEIAFPIQVELKLNIYWLLILMKDFVLLKGDKLKWYNKFWTRLTDMGSSGEVKW